MGEEEFVKLSLVWLQLINKVDDNKNNKSFLFICVPLLIMNYIENYIKKRQL
jgi:hypothetical protein